MTQAISRSTTPCTIKFAVTSAYERCTEFVSALARKIKDLVTGFFQFICSFLFGKKQSVEAPAAFAASPIAAAPTPVKEKSPLKTPAPARTEVEEPDEDLSPFPESPRSHSASFAEEKTEEKTNEDLVKWTLTPVKRRGSFDRLKGLFSPGEGRKGLPLDAMDEAAKAVVETFAFYIGEISRQEDIKLLNDQRDKDRKEIPSRNVSYQGLVSLLEKEAGIALFGEKKFEAAEPSEIVAALIKGTFDGAPTGALISVEDAKNVPQVMGIYVSIKDRKSSLYLMDPYKRRDTAHKAMTCEKFTTFETLFQKFPKGTKYMICGFEGTK